MPWQQGLLTNCQASSVSSLAVLCDRHSGIITSRFHAYNVTSFTAGVGVAFQANDLPNPLVEISTPHHDAHTFWTKHTLNPKFPTTDPAVYDRLPSDSVLTLKLFDNKGTLTKRRRRVLLGSNTLCCAHFHGEDPLYVWLPMRPPARRRHHRTGLLPPPGQVPDLQASC